MNDAVPLNIVLHEKQKLIHASQARWKYIKAGKRFGKTKWAIFELLQKAGETPNGLYWYTAPTYRHAKSIAWHEMLWMLPKQYVLRKQEQELTLYLTNNCRIELKGEENEDSLRGPEADGYVRDEVALNKRGDEVWGRILSGQLKSNRRSFCYNISSPNPSGRNWYTNACEDARIKMVNGEKDFAYWHFDIYDNPTLLPDEVQRTKDANTDDAWNLEYLALESQNAGQLYSEFNYGVHCMEWPFRDSGMFVRGLDWGIAHPTVCLWANFDHTRPLNPEFNPVYVYDEYYKSGNLINESCSIIKLKTGNRNVDWSVGDPSMCKRNSQTNRTDADEFARNGVPFHPGDNRDRGYDITKMFFKKNLIRINPKCTNLISELRNLQYDDKTGDDATDALRYLMTRIHDFTYRGEAFEQKPVSPFPIINRELNFKMPMFLEGKTGSYSQSIGEQLINEVA